MDAHGEIERIQAALDQAYAKLIALRRDHEVGDLEEVHAVAEEDLAGARTLAKALDALPSRKAD